MADEPTPTTPAEPTLSLEDLSASIATSVKAALAETLRSAPPQPATVTPDALGSVLEPYLRDVRVAVADAKDHSAFYQMNPAAAKHQTAIEEKFNQLLRARTPWDRSTIYNEMRGREFDKFRTEANTAEQAAQAAAAQAGTLGPGTPPRSTSFEDPFSMDSEELGKRLHGVSF